MRGKHSISPSGEQPQVPPPNVPIRSFTTPVTGEGFYTEIVDTTRPEYRIIERGTKYSIVTGADPNVIAIFPDLYFLRETILPYDYPWATRLWATDRNAEDTYNSAIEYIAQAVSYPAFTRVYIVRRDEYEVNSTIAIGSPLTSIIGVKIVDGGQDYTTATVVITGLGTGATAKAIINVDGTIASIVVDNCGTGYTATPTVTITGSGSGALAIALLQPTSAVLTSQKKSELPDDHPLRNEYVLVTRVYETLPGPFIASTKIDEDGKVVTVNTRRNIAANITSAETLIAGQWCKTTKKGDDNFVGEESVECRAIPGNAIPYTKIDDDGKVVSGTRTLKDQSVIVSAETLTGGVWTHTFKEKVGDLVSWEVTESRAIPGNPVPSSRLGEDGVKIDVVTTLKDTTAITTTEALSGGVWTKTTKKEVSDLVAQEIVESRAIPGNGILETQIDKNGDITSITRTLVEASTLATTNVILAGVWTKTYEVPLDGSKLVATKTVEVRDTQNELDSLSIEIPDLLPVEFRPQLPIIELEGTFIGDAVLPTLIPGELFSKQTQLDAYTYRSTRRGRIGISLPQVITNKETTSQFGGGDINVILTLDLFNNLSLDEGLTYLVPSEIKKLDSELNGLAVKTSKQLNAAAWPPLDSTHVDEKYGLVVPIQKQVVAAGAIGGVSGGVYTEVRSIDKWKSLTIASRLDAESLPENVQWFSSIRYSFPPELTDAVIDWAYAECGCSYSFSAVLIANMNQYSGIVKSRVTEQFYNGPPPDDVTITQFFPQSHHFGFAWWSACGDSDGNCRTKSGSPEFHVPLALHDDLSLSVGANVWTFPATDPAVLPHSDYIMLAPHVERWRFGVFRRVLTEVLVP